METRSAVMMSACFVAMAMITGCGDKPAKPAESPSAAPEPVTTKSAPVTTNNKSDVGVGEDLAKLCNIQFGAVDRAPKFDFEQSDLPQDDRAVLDQVGKCMTQGPLKGRSLTLVGRADPRGETEYNMSLGEHRADSVRRYLLGLGVPAKQLAETSRGKLDASGTDETTWRNDRRVDLVLK